MRQGNSVRPRFFVMDLGIRVNPIMASIHATPFMLGAPQKVLDSLAAPFPP